MNFGAEFSAYDKISFSLPADHNMNHSVLSKGNGTGTVHIGLERWGDKRFVDSLFPIGAKQNDFLTYYAEHFNAIELNATHYKIYTEPEIRKWVDKIARQDFLFCSKFLQSVSYLGNPMVKKEEAIAFMNGLVAFGSHLGPIFIQISEKLGADKIGNILSFLHFLTSSYPNQQFFIELRNPEWFTADTWNELTRSLTEMGIGLVITDTPGRRDVLHMTLTNPQLFLRFVCMGNHANDDARLMQWKERIELWKRQGLNDAFIFLHIHDETQMVTYSKKVQKMFGLESPDIIVTQRSLF